MGFRKVNEESLREVSSENKPLKEYKVNQDGVWPLLSAEDLVGLQEPAKASARKQLAEAGQKEKTD